jgi:F420-0:gamma-glutamyl ligase
MHIKPVKTKLIEPGENLFKLVTLHIDHIPERSVLAIVSKAFSFAENRLVPKVTGDKQEKWNLVKKEAQYYLEPDQSQYELMFTIKGNWMFVNAGLDESNSAGHYSLWPKDPQGSLNHLWQQVRDRYRLQDFGMIMTDSKSFPSKQGGNRARHRPLRLQSLKQLYWHPRPLQQRNANGTN